MNKLLIAASNWLNGWRQDLDGWIVRAKRASDPDLTDRSEIGFTEEASISVRTPELAFRIDQNQLI